MSKRAPVTGIGHDAAESKHAETKSKLLDQREAAGLLKVSPRYLRDSRCPKVILPSNGRRGRGIVRYDGAEVMTWARSARQGQS